MLLKAMQVLILLKLQILLTLNYNLKMLNLQLNKPIELLTELKYFEFVTTLVSLLIKIEKK